MSSQTLDPTLQAMLFEERCQSHARLRVGIIASTLFTTLFWLNHVTAMTVLLVWSAVLFSYAWFLKVRAADETKRWRRRTVIFFDIFVVSSALYLGEAWGSLFYFLYLWIVVGNGIRFGKQALLEAMFCGLVGFAIVLQVTPFWQSNAQIGYGLLAGVVILPLFYLDLIKRLHELNEQLNTELNNARFAATHDAMTGLYNRSFFFDAVERKLATDRASLAVVFVDLDGFKAVNDSCGHHCGDALLRHIADTLSALAGDGDVVARLGGDEFALLLDGAQAADAEQFARQVILAVDRPLKLDECEVSVTASVGISLGGRDGQDSDTLVRAADTAMYQSKHSGKNRFCFYASDPAPFSGNIAQQPFVPRHGRRP